MKTCGADSDRISRKKACAHCIAAKARCDLEKPMCSRCSIRGEDCDYSPNNRWTLHDSAADSTPSTSSIENAGPSPTAHELQSNEIHVAKSECSPTIMYETGDHLWNLKTMPFEEMTSIRDRWLFPCLPKQIRVGPLNKSVVETYGRILQTYPTLMSRQDQLPPFIHKWQLSQTSGAAYFRRCRELTGYCITGHSGAEAQLKEWMHKGMEIMSSKVRRNSFVRVPESNNSFNPASSV